MPTPSVYNKKSGVNPVTPLMLLAEGTEGDFSDTSPLGSSLHWRNAHRLLQLFAALCGYTANVVTWTMLYWVVVYVADWTLGLLPPELGQVPTPSTPSVAWLDLSAFGWGLVLPTGNVSPCASTTTPFSSMLCSFLVWKEHMYRRAQVHSMDFVYTLTFGSATESVKQIVCTVCVWWTCVRPILAAMYTFCKHCGITVLEQANRVNEKTYQVGTDIGRGLCSVVVLTVDCLYHHRD